MKCAELSNGIKELRPATNMVTAIIGRVRRRRDRRPKVSIVQIAGKAPTKFMKPKTQEARRALKSLKPESEKI